MELTFANRNAGHEADQAVDPETSSAQDAAASAPELEKAARAIVNRLGGVKRNGAASSRYKVSQFDIPVALADGSTLLFNAQSRSLILLAADETKAYRALTERSFPTATIDDRLLLQTLADGGHIVGENTDELAIVRDVFESRRSVPDHLSLTIAPTMACNFSCGYCFQGPEKPESKMSPEVEEAIFAAVGKLQNLKSLSLTWYGGEPLMARDVIFRLSDRMIAYCDKHKIRYSAGMVSNGYLLTAELAQQFYSRRIGWVQVTIDGDQETHDKMRPLTSGRGTFDKIVENIGTILDTTPLSISTRVNVGRSCVTRAHALLDRFAELNFSKRGKIHTYFAKIETATEEGDGALHEKLPQADFNRAMFDLEAKARELGLSATIAPSQSFEGLCVASAHNGYVVVPNGDVHKCWETAHDPSRRVGTVFELDKLRESANGQLWKQWSPFDNPVCTACKILPLCGGQCALRFVYARPEHGATPCQKWKWNTAEYIFGRAVALGAVTPDLWLPEQATEFTQPSGEAHTTATLMSARAHLLEKVAARPHACNCGQDRCSAGEVAADICP